MHIVRLVRPLVRGSVNIEIEEEMRALVAEFTIMKINYY
jgi:hypothetical protein